MFPPEDVQASELFRKLSEAPRPSEVVDFPRRDPVTKLPVAKVRIQVLNLDEHDEARIKADVWLREKKRIDKSLLEGKGIQQVLADRVARELLAMACLSVNAIPGTEDQGKPKYARQFITADQLAFLMPDELEALWMMHQMVQHRYGPYEGNLESDEQTTAWMKRLAEGASALPLGRLGWHHLVELTTSLAERAYTLSAILAGQSSNLPPTLAASLKNWGIGTTSFGVRPASATSIGLTEADLGISESPEFAGVTEEELEAMMAPKLPDRPVTPAEAAELARTLFRHEDE
jgi:hypothetical protein